MPPLDLIFRTSGSWGSGIGRNLTAAEADQNINELGTAVQDLQDNPPTGISITSIRVDQLNMYITLSNGNELGPFPLPVLEFRFRGAWTPFTIYAAVDVFVVDGDGLYVVLLDHTSGATFDPAIEVGGSPALQKLMGTDSGTFANVYDVDFYYPGRPRDTTSSYIVELILLRDAIVPISGTQHFATLDIAPSTAIQTFQILHSGAHIGDLTFAIGSTTGVITWIVTADEKILKGEKFQIGKPATDDATARGLSGAFALQRVVT